MRHTSNRLNVTKLIVSILTFAMILTAALAYNQDASAASKGKLLKSVTVYTKKGKKWKKTLTTSYSYNSKKDPIKITSKGSDYKAVRKLSYTYKAGKRATRTEKTDYSTLKYTYDKKGRLSAYYYGDKSEEPSETYKYDSKGTFKKIISSSSMDVVFTTKYYSGSNTKSVTAYWLDGKKKQLDAKAAFNKKGFVTQYVNSTVGGDAAKYSYKYRKDGLVNYVISNSYGYQEKLVFSYNSKKIDMSRYKAMINNTLCGMICTGKSWY